MRDHQLFEVRQRIANAKQQESETNRLQKALKKTLPRLHGAIQLPQNAPEQALLDFIVHYVEHVPDFIEAVIQISADAGITDSTETFVELCLDYFLTPPNLVHDHSGLFELLDEAYLAHRLMEEVNDQMMTQCNIPLIPMDMTKANLIAHALIGESFANKLDMAIYYSLEMVLLTKKQHLNRESVIHYITYHQQHGWNVEINQWPCLTEDLTIKLTFNGE